MKRLLTIAFLLAIAFPPISSAGNLRLTIPARIGHVNDFSDIFSTEDQVKIEDKLKDFEKKTKITFIFVSLPILDCIFYEQDCAIEVNRQWNVTKNYPNSVILLVSGINNRSRTYLGLSRNLEIDQTEFDRFIKDTIKPLINGNKLANAYVNYIDFVIRSLHFRNQ